MSDELTPEMLLHAYSMGAFPMANSRDDPSVHWIEARKRGIMPLDGFHMSRSLARAIRRPDYQVRIDTAFSATVEGCASREETWINAPILAAYRRLHGMGYAHSIEVWAEDVLIGGLYGVALGAAFFGESMFSQRRDASKIALAYTVHRLRAGGFTLFDTQFLTPHLASMGGVEIPRAEYLRHLSHAMGKAARFAPQGYAPQPSLISSMGSSGASGVS